MAQESESIISTSGSTASVAPFVDLTNQPSAPRTNGIVLAGASPFVSEWELDNYLPPSSPAVDAVGELLDELHDEEFDRAVDELVGEVVSRQGIDFSGEIGDDWQRDRRVAETLSPLASAAETMIDAMSARVGELDPLRVTETEIDEILAPTLPRLPGGSPAFENFLSSLWKKAKSIVKGAAKLAKKGISAVANFALGPLLGKLKSLVKPLLDKVVAFALDKIPEPYRSLARRLATPISQGLPGGVAGLVDVAKNVAGQAVTAAVGGMVPQAISAASALPEAGDEGALDAAGAASHPSAADVGEIQSELDSRIGEILVGEDMPAQEVRSGEPLAELDAARERFMRELAESEDPRPAVENFIPAIIAALRLGVNVIGRARVVRFLGDLIGNLIKPVAPGGLASKLGQVIADIGLKTFLQTELGAEDHAQLAREAIAQTVEETVRTLAALPESAFEHEAVLESHALEAFEAAAANHFPPSLLRPEMRPAGGMPAVWLTMPRRRHRRYYKKYSHGFDIVITPEAARSVHVFGGGTLAAYLRDRLGLPATGNLRARLHLYEIMPGGRHAHVRLGESRPIGDLHPLTPHAAASLLGHPGLGRHVAGTPDPMRPRVGERLYSMELEAAPLARPGHVSHFHVSIHPYQASARVCIYLSEHMAQAISVSLRKRLPVAHAIRDIRHATAGHRRVRISGPHGRAFDGGAVLHGLRKALGRRIASWIWAPLADYLSRSAPEFIAAADGPDHGVTVRITLEGIPGLRMLLNPTQAPLTHLLRQLEPGGFGQVRVQTRPGFHS